VIFTAVL